MLERAGLSRVRPRIVQHAGLLGESKVMPARTLENIRATAIRHGVSTDDELDGLVDELYALAADPAAYVSNPRMVQVVGEKPTS